MVLEIAHSVFAHGRGYKMVGNVKIKLSDIKKDIDNQYSKSISKNFATIERVLNQKIEQIVSQRLLAGLPVIQGNDLAEIGVPDINTRLVSIVQAIATNIRVKVSGTKRISLNITILEDDYSDVLSLPEAVYAYTSARGSGILEWAKWILLGGNGTIVGGFDFAPVTSPFSRTGGGLMRPGGGWRMPPGLSGTANDNILTRALENIEVIVHAAALKQVPAAEYNPMEFVKTNVYGADNLIQACLDSDVKNVVALSTDKAAGPVNLYGATKLCSDKLFVAANNIKGNRDIKFSTVRYGNVMGSRGSVIPFFLQKIKNHESILPITSNSMTRFNISLIEGVNMVLWALENSIGGEILIPKIPSYKITDLAEAIGPNCEKKVIGIRPGEKVHEDLITSAESFSTIDIGNLYAILPNPEYHLGRHDKKFPLCKKVPEGFQYNSGTNKNFLSIYELRELIKEHIDEKFKPF